MKRFAKAMEVLGTRVEIAICLGGASGAEGEASALFELAFEECLRVENLYSRFKRGNYLDALNSCLGEKMKVSEEMYELLKFADEMYCNTGGVFDVRVKRVLENLGYDAEYSFERKVFEGVSGFVEGKSGVSGIELFEDNFVRISEAVDFGGLGKGYVLDLVKEQFSGVENFMINAGGDIYARGKDLEIGAWRMVFENPLNPEEGIGVVEVDDFFLASSSPVRRSWEGGHHLVDPRTGESANEMMAVYVQADKGIVADSYATALFVMGYERAVEFLKGNAKSLHVQTLEAMLVSPRGEIFRSAGFKGELFS